MRVLMVSTSYPRHAGDHAGHFVAALAEHLVRLGHVVTVLAPHEGRLPLREMLGGIHVERFAYLPGAAERVAYGNGIVENVRRSPLAAIGLPFFAHALRRATRRLATDADIVHVHWGPTAALAAPWRLETPYVITLHGSDVTLARRGGIWERLLRVALRQAAGVDVVAEEQREYLLQDGLWSAGRPLVVIPSGVEDELVERTPIGRSDGAFEFVFVGRLLATKGVPELLEAFIDLNARGVDARLCLVGAGPLESVLRERADGAGVGDRVVMRGALEHGETLEVIAASDALVLPSHGEGSPLVVAEALALGTPVIGTRVGAIPELLGAGGLVVEPGDTVGLLEAMERLAGDPALRERLSHDGREWARTHLSWSAIACATDAFYRAAAKGSAGGANGGVRA
ncbi:MAG: glycosyltransferase family 4 protein [Coriobacteriia bacterium]|nr:glycosyltransferase family 4 protein [Coriobacteriia bacterium]